MSKKLLVIVFVLVLGFATNAYAQDTPTFTIDAIDGVGRVTESLVITISGGPVDGSKFEIEGVAFPVTALADGTYTVFTQNAIPAVGVVILGESSSIFTSGTTVELKYDGDVVAEFDIPTPPPPAPTAACSATDPVFGTVEILINQPVSTVGGTRLCIGDGNYGTQPVDPNAFATPIDSDLLWVGAVTTTSGWTGGSVVTTGTWVPGSTTTTVSTGLCLTPRAILSLYDESEVVRGYTAAHSPIPFAGWDAQGRMQVVYQGAVLHLGLNESMNSYLTPTDCVAR